MNVREVTKQYLENYFMEDVKCPMCGRVDMRWTFAGNFPGCVKCLKEFIK